MSNWFHTVLGRYNIADKWIGLDYGKLFLDPIQAHITLAHEAVHGVLAMQDFGQASNIVIKLLNDFTHLDDQQKNEIGTLLVQKQKFVQEGFATFFEVSQLRKLTNRNNAIDWAQKNLPKDYMDRFEKLIFAFDLSQGYRDFFTSKISELAMETGIRRIAPKVDLLRTPEALNKYLSQSDNSPNARLEKMIDTLRYKSWLVTKSVEEIAAACGIAFHTPSTKQEVAGFLNYATALTNNPKTFTADDIGNTPRGAEAFIETTQNMIVANMNINLAETAVTLFKLDDFLFYSDVIEMIFVNPNDEFKHRDIIKHISGNEPEINIGGFLRTGEKYLTTTSKQKALEILSNELRNATMMVKWGGYDPVGKRLIWSDQARKPDLIVYNTAQQMLLRIQELIKAQPNIKFIHLHAAATQDHPLRTLFVKVDNQIPIHAVNTYGNKGIVEVLKILQQRSRTMSNEELKTHKKHLNNLLSLWMGLHWEIDWVETMLDGKELIYRSN